MASLEPYFQPKPGRSVLEFTTELVRGQFARSYVSLFVPETISPDDANFAEKHHLAVKQQLAGDYTDCYFFLIESVAGALEADQWDDDDGDDDDERSRTKLA